MKTRYIEVQLMLQDGPEEDAARLTFDAYTVVPAMLPEMASEQLPDIVRPLVESVVRAAVQRLQKEGNL